MDKIEGLLKQKQYEAATLWIERELDQEGKDVSELLKRVEENIPFEVLSQSPRVMIALGEYWLGNGKLFESKRITVSAIRRSAEICTPKEFIHILALISQIHIRMGNHEEAEDYLDYLQSEYQRKETEMKGTVPLTLALGDAYLKNGNGGQYLLEAFQMFQNKADFQGMAHTLIEMLLCYKGPEFMQKRLAHYYQTFITYTPYLKRDEMCQALVRLCYMIREQDWTRQDVIAALKVNGLSLYDQALAAVLLQFINGKRRELGLKEKKVKFPDYHGADIGINELKQLFDCMEPPNITPPLADEFEWCSCRIPSHRNIREMLRKSVWNVTTESGRKIIVIDVKTFNGLVIQGPNLSSIQKWKRRKSLEVFVYFLLGRKTRLSKDKLIDAVFPAAEDLKQAKNHLNVSLYALNQIVADHLGIQQFVQAQGRDVWLHPSVEFRTDVHDFYKWVDEGNKGWKDHTEDAVKAYDRAISLYGPFLETDGLDSIDWIDDIREELKQEQLKMLRRLAMYHSNYGDFEKAEAFYLEAIRLDRLDLHSYNEYIQLLELQHRMFDAIKWKERRDRILFQEYGLT